MKNPRRQIKFSTAARWLCALLAVLALPLNGFAQPKSPERWLFVFDLSPAMKSRLPATEAVLKNFFATGADGRLQDGDYIGAWTYDQKMHAGQFPLATWRPGSATALASNLTVFLRAQPFKGDSTLAALQPALGSVVADSERLTIVIFCAGESGFTGTPYDSGINQNFLDGRAERKKSGQPFVVLIRTLSGKYVGCTVNYPPGTINIPLFLAPPPPTNIPPPTAVVTVVKPPPVVVPDLILTGTPPSPPAVAPKEIPPPMTNPVPPVPVEVPKIITAPATNPMPATIATPAAPVATNPIPATPPAKVETPAAVPAASAVTTPPPATVAPPVTTPATNNAAAAATDATGSGMRRLALAGLGLLAAAGVLAAVLILRPGRRQQGSLISSSMQDDPRRK